MFIKRASKSATKEKAKLANHVSKLKCRKMQFTVRGKSTLASSLLTGLFSKLRIFQ